MTDNKVEWKTDIGTISEDTPWIVIITWLFSVFLTIDVNLCWLTAVHLLFSPRRAYCVRNESFNECIGDTYQRHIDKWLHWLDETWRGLILSKVDITFELLYDHRIPDWAPIIIG